MEFNKDIAHQKFLENNPQYTSKSKKPIYIYKWRPYSVSKEKQKQYFQTRKMRYPEKIHARNILASAIRRDKIKRGTCDICGNMPIILIIQNP